MQSPVTISLLKIVVVNWAEIQRFWGWQMESTVRRSKCVEHYAVS